MKAVSSVSASRSRSSISKTLSNPASDKPETLVQVALTPCQTGGTRKAAVTCRSNTRNTAISNFDVNPADGSETVFTSAKDKKNKSGSTDKQSIPATDKSSDCSGNKWRCKTCSMKFSALSALRRHNKSIHSNKTKPLSCEECDARFDRADALKRHKSTHQSDRIFFVKHAKNYLKRPRY